MNRMIFVNLPVADLERAKAFWKALGFDHNPQFSDETAACIVISEQIYFMVMTHEKFLGFTNKKVSDSRTTQEALISLSAGSRAEVDALADTALKSDGSAAKPDMDLGFMYQRSFQDPDGHHFEVGYMDMSQMPAN
jgi:predicted lactoylglutathione lyase